MPIYTVRNTTTNELSDLPVMSWEQFQQFLQDEEVVGRYEPVMTAPSMVKVQ